MPSSLEENHYIDLAGSIAYPGVDFKNDVESGLPTPPPRYLSAQEGAENIAIALHDAINKLVPLEPSSDFSGGLDSTILGLATSKKRGVDGFVQYTDYTAGGDLQYARRFAKLGTITLHELYGESDVLPFAEAPPMSVMKDVPYRGFAIFGRENQRLAAVASLGKEHHLHGNGGDVLFDPDPRFIMAELLSSGDHKQAEAFVMAYAKASLKNPEDIMREIRLIHESTLADSYQRVAHDLKEEYTGATAHDWLPSSRSSRWLTPQSRELLAERAAYMASSSSGWSSPADYAIAMSIRDGREGDIHLQELAKTHGITIHTPYLDTNVITSVLAVPPAERIAAGQYRPLMLQAARHILGDTTVDALSTRQSKTSYNTEMRVGITNDLQRGEQSIIQKHLATLGRLGIVDVDAVQKDLFACNVQRDFPLSALAQLVSVGASLEKYDDEHEHTQKRTRASQQTPERTDRLIAPHYNLAKNYYVQREDCLFVLHPTSTRDGAEYTYTALNTQSGYILRQLASGTAPDAIMSRQQDRYPAIDPQRIRGDIELCCQRLESAGIIIAAPVAADEKTYIPNKITTTGIVSHDERLRVRAQDYALSETEKRIAEQSLITVQKLRQPSFDVPTIIAAMESGKEALQPATASQARRALEVAHAITKDVANERVACLTVSLLAAEILKQQGAAIYWSIGVHPISPDFHAWIETQDGTRVASASDDSPESYLPFFRA